MIRTLSLYDMNGLVQQQYIVAAAVVVVWCDIRLCAYGVVAILRRLSQKTAALG